jgi:antitoxin HigA-1
MNIYKRKPTHPGKMLLELYIKPMKMTLIQASKYLGISRKQLSSLVHERCNLSVEMAVRIAKATNTSAESWIDGQTKLDLWVSKQNEPKNVKVFPECEINTYAP